MLLLTFVTTISNNFASVTFLQFDVIHFCDAAGSTAPVANAKPKGHELIVIVLIVHRVVSLNSEPKTSKDNVATIAAAPRRFHQEIMDWLGTSLSSRT